MHRGVDFLYSLFCYTFFTKTWNFYGNSTVAIFEKVQKMEIVIIENTSFT